ncbi:MAG: alpha/beta fold hydrolase [Panacagrimonas sp.]
MKTLDWQRGDLESNGIRLHVESAGSERGEPLLLVMGLGCQLIQWPESLCAGLVARGFRVVRFDNRDIGLSGNANRGLRFDLRADYLRTRVGFKPGAANYTLHDMATDVIGVPDAFMAMRTP